MNEPTLSVVIPTYCRGQIVLETIRQFRACVDNGTELIIVDQTPELAEAELQEMTRLASEGAITWIRLPHPSIPAAMNVGLQRATGAAVLFLDDDIRLDGNLVPAHRAAQANPGLVAGQVLQPGEQPVELSSGQAFCFSSNTGAHIAEFMGGNFSVNREVALLLGGFDENFVGAAYRFEAEFAHRYVKKHGWILFDPRASVRHLAISTGGTRSNGHHLRTTAPHHSVGAYYYLMRVRPPWWWISALWRPVRAVRTRHHLRHPWWIPATLVAEARGLLWALGLMVRGPGLIQPAGRNIQNQPVRAIKD